MCLHDEFISTPVTLFKTITMKKVQRCVQFSFLDHFIHLKFYLTQFSCLQGRPVFEILQEAGESMGRENDVGLIAKTNMLLW